MIRVPGKTRQTRGAGCGFWTGTSWQTRTRTRATHTRLPTQVCKPVTGITDDLRRNWLEAEAFGKLQILKYAYCSNFLNGSEEAALHEPFREIEIK